MQSIEGTLTIWEIDARLGMVQLKSCSASLRRRHMKFILVNGRAPCPQSSCAFCCEPIGSGYLRELSTRLSYCNQHCYFGHSELITPALETATKESWGILRRMS